MPLLERLKLNDWRLEIVTVLFTALFVFFYKAGDWYNQSLVTKFLAGVKDVFEENFAQFGVGQGQLYVKDSSENYSSYASGRENISKVNMTFRLVPRQNFFVWIMELGFSFFTEAVQKPVDRLEMVVFPSVDYDNFITAVVSKLGMNDFRKFQYFLSLTRTTDSPLLPESFVFMSEVNEYQEKTLTKKFANALHLSMAPFLRYVAFTDQPNDKPELIRDLLPVRRVIISINLVTGKEELKQISEVIAAVFDVIDQLASKEITFKVESAKKIVKARETEIKKIQKAEDDFKAEQLAEEKAKLKRQERDELRNMSREDQMKAEKRSQDRKQRKMQKKMKVRG